MKRFTYALKNSGNSCIAIILRPDGHGVDINTYTSLTNMSTARYNAKKWAEKRVAYYNANYPELTED